MDATTVAVDLAKSVFQLAVADSHWRIIERARVTRGQFERWFVNRSVGLVVMEACGSAHHWARHLQGLGIEVRLLPPKYVRAYVKRNKTDAADAAGLLEAARCTDIQAVRIKSNEQQALQSLHRTRSLWMATRTSRINALRGFCREFGLAISLGSRLGVEQIDRLLADPGSTIPELLRPTMRLLLEEIRLLEVRISRIEQQLTYPRWAYGSLRGKHVNQTGIMREVDFPVLRRSIQSVGCTRPRRKALNIWAVAIWKVEAEVGSSVHDDRVALRESERLNRCVVHDPRSEVMTNLRPLLSWLGFDVPLSHLSPSEVQGEPPIAARRNWSARLRY